MEFFVCSCPVTGTVILDGNAQGPNKSGSGGLLTKQCNTGLHTISLQFASGKICAPAQVTVTIKNTNPISPMEVAFQCV